MKQILALLILLLLALNANATFTTYLDSSTYNSCSIYWDENQLSDAMAYVQNHNIDGTGNYDLNFNYTVSADITDDGIDDLVFYRDYQDPDTSTPAYTNDFRVSYIPNTGTNANPIFNWDNKNNITGIVYQGVRNDFIDRGEARPAVCDYDQDGKNDIFGYVYVYCNPNATGAKIGYWHNDGSGTFSYQGYLTALGTYNGIPSVCDHSVLDNVIPTGQTSIACADLDGDNYPELMVSGNRYASEFPDNYQDGVNIFKNNGGIITTASYVQTLAPFGSGVYGGDWSFSSFGLFDANNDGKLDIGVKKSKWDQGTNSQRWTQFYRNNSTIGNFSFASESFGGGYSTFGPLTPTKLYGGQALDINKINTGTTYPWPYIGFMEIDQNSRNYVVKRNNLAIGTSISKSYIDSAGLSSATSYTYSVDAYKGITFNETSTNLVCTTSPFPFTVENIANLGSYYFDSLHLNPSDETKELIVKITNVYPAATDLNIFIENSLNDGRQYFIYTSSDGISWVFNDSLTNGTTDSNPIQKIWDDTNKVYQYRFQESFLASEIKYYKFTYRLPSRYYSTVASSSSWWNQYEPEQQDINGIMRDVWTVTYYSNVFSKNLDAEAIITGGGLVTSAQSYELQFNAYKTTSDVVNVIIERYNDKNYGETVISTIPLTLNEHRYSVPITLYDANETIVIKTNAQSFSSNVIFSDYALEESNYFRDRMILLKENYELLDQWIDVNSNSHAYIEEGQPFRFQTTIYDRDGKILTETIRVYAYGTNDANRVYQADHNITEPIEENIRTLSEVINGIVLIKEGRITGVTTPIKVTVTICDATTCLAEQSQWLRLHNYPFFPTDFFLQNQEQTRTLNVGPKGRFFIQSRLPNTVSALRVRIYLGQFMCAIDQAGQTIDGVPCTGSRVAPDVNKVFEKYLYRNLDFTCNPSEDCSFDYDFGDEFHYFYEFPFTTITNLMFNTTDSNDFWARTLYTIGKQPLFVWAEIQGIPDTQAADTNCYPSLMGTKLKGYDSVSLLRNALMANSIYPNYINGCWTPLLCGSTSPWTQNRHNEFTQAVFDNGGDIPDEWKNSFMGKLADSSACEKIGGHGQAYKVVAKVVTTDLSDIHQYVDAYFTLTEINLAGATLRAFSNRFYPIQTYFDNLDNTAVNTFIWNSNLYDENGNSIRDNNRYKINMTLTDNSLRNQTANSTLNFRVDDDNISDTNAYFQPLNSLFYSPIDGGVEIQGTIMTNGLQIDQIQGTLLTNYSGFDTLKSNMENQIQTFNIGIEDIIKLREKTDYSLGEDWNLFITNNSNIAAGACISKDDGIIFSADSVFISDSNGIIDNFAGRMAGWLIEHTLNVQSTTVSGCGTGKYINNIFAWQPFFDEGGKMAIRREITDAFRKFEGQKYRTLNIKIIGSPNNYEELKALGGFSDENTSPQTIINDLAKKGLSPIEAPIVIEFTDLGKRFTLPNYLVASGNMVDIVERRDAKIKFNIKTNNFQNQTSIIYDLADFKTDARGRDWWAGLNADLRGTISNNLVTIFVIVLVIISLYTVMRIIPPSGR